MTRLSQTDVKLSPIVLSRNNRILSHLPVETWINAREFSFLPLFDGEILQFRYAAPVLFRHEGDEYLREVDPGDEEGERYHQHEQNLLIDAELADVRQQVVEVQVLGLLFLLIVPLRVFVPSLLDGRFLLARRESAALGRGRGRQAVGTRLLQIVGGLLGRGILLLRRHAVFDRNLRSTSGKERRQHFLRTSIATFRRQPSGCCDTALSFSQIPESPRTRLKKHSLRRLRPIVDDDDSEWNDAGKKSSRPGEHIGYSYTLYRDKTTLPCARVLLFLEYLYRGN